MNKFITGLVSTGLLVLSGLAHAVPVNINTADAAALAAGITGVGLKRAEAIIDFRDSNGPFRSVDELTRVRGIGLKLVEQNRENLRIADQ